MSRFNLIFLFLGSFRSVLVPVVAIPLSLVGAVFLMEVFGFTINLLTLLAIVLSVGLVVDDAIVVVENVERHLSEGKSPTDAALLGARELVGPIIAMTVTLAMFGALVFTFLKMPDPNVPFWTSGWTTTLNIYSQVGLVTLVGLVSKNGILVVEFANKLQENGLGKREAVREAALTRLRPILMTSGATIAGHFPLTLVTGAGAAARNSIGLVLVGGMAAGTVFTLFVIPSIYMLVARDHAKSNRQAGKAAEAAA